MDPQTAFTMALVAAIIGGLALLVSGASLAWNIISWRRSGRKIILEIKVRVSDGHQIVDYTPEAGSEVVGETSLRDYLRSEGFAEVAVLFEVRNEGRLAATIKGCYLATPRGQHVSVGRSWKANVLPDRIEAGDGKEFVFPLAHFAKAVQEEHTQIMNIIPSVLLGTGERIVARQKLENYAVIGSSAPPVMIKGRHHDHVGDHSQLGEHG